MSSSRAIAAIAVVGQLALAADRQSPQQTAPVFRGGIDLVTVDVMVVDAKGRPVTNLTSADFSIVADRRPRAIVSAQFVPAAIARPAPFESSRPASTSAPTSNRLPIAGRTFLFVVDTDEISQGGGRVALASMTDYLDRLSPADRVGLVALPTGTPRVDVTVNRGLIRKAAASIGGVAPRGDTDAMTVGEAASIEMMDQAVMLEYLQRICPRCDPPAQIPTSQVTALMQQAERTMTIHRRHTRSAGPPRRRCSASTRSCPVITCCHLRATPTIATAAARVSRFASTGLTSSSAPAPNSRPDPMTRNPRDRRRRHPSQRLQIRRRGFGNCCAGRRLMPTLVFVRDCSSGGQEKPSGSRSRLLV